MTWALMAMIRGGDWHVPPEAANWQNPAPDSPGALGEARQIYDEKCAHCHGDNGRGDGPDARDYDPRPTNFTEPAVAREPDGVLFYKLSKGKRPMPSFRRKLNEHQRWELIRLIRTFGGAAIEPAK